jgi:membrane protein
MLRNLRAILALLVEALTCWSSLHGTLLAAGLAYYTLFSLAPLLVIGVSLAGHWYGEAAVTGRLVSQVSHVAGPKAAEGIQYLLATREIAVGGGATTAISLALLLYGASMMFSQLKYAINLLWGIAPQPNHNWFLFFRTRFLSFLMVLAIALLLVAFMFVSTMVVTINQRLRQLPPAAQEILPEADFGLMFIGFAILFAMIFKTLPDARIAWQDVLVGASVTSLLFTLGEFLIGYLLSWVSVTTAYGAMGTVALLLFWLYYSMQIILYGAAFTAVYSNRYGATIRPASRAARVIRNLEHGV